MKRPFSIRRTAPWLAAAALVMPGITGVAMAAETFGDFGWWLPENVFPGSEPIDRLFNFTLYLTGTVNIAVFVVLGWFLIQYRYNPKRQATFIHGNNQLEAVWTLIPTIILALTAVFSQTIWSSMKHPDHMPSGDDVIEVKVYARQFAWYFHYPGEDGKFGPRKTSLIDPSSSEPDALIGLDRSHEDAKDDIVAVRMVVPVNRKVRVTELTSVDVIHSFFLPNFRIKQDAVPGLNTQVWLESTKTSAQVVGTFADGSPKPFDIVCAELCGQGHYRMRGELYVVSEEEYEAFLAAEAAFLQFGGDDDDYY